MKDDRKGEPLTVAQKLILIVQAKMMIEESQDQCSGTRKQTKVNQAAACHIPKFKDTIDSITEYRDADKFVFDSNLIYEGGF